MWQRIARCNRGAVALEYALVAAIVSAGVVAGLGVFLPSVWAHLTDLLTAAY